MMSEQEKSLTKKKNGSAAAAMIASMIAILSLGIANLITVMSKDAKLIIHEIGKVWIPGAEAIGPYSGKETVMLLGWGLSWIILYYTLRNHDVRLSIYTIIFIIGVGIATLFVWNPFVDLIT